MPLSAKEKHERKKELSRKRPEDLKTLLVHANLLGDHDVWEIHEEETETLLQEGVEPVEIKLVEQYLRVNFEYAGHHFYYGEDIDENELWDQIKEERFDV